ncbi:Uncharacterised protein [uncultured Comamonas sp.]|nr:Uncharacterised protein [uncultured Comamonas sp.]
MTPEQAPAPASRQRPVWLRALAWLAAALVLLAVFGLYLEPDFMLTMADQVWACF